MRSSDERGADARAGHRPVAGSIELLGKRARSLVLARVTPDESISSPSWLCLAGESGNALVALASRLLVVKAGLAARLTLANELESFEYSDIDEIGLVVGEVNSVIEVRSSTRRPAGKEWWQARDPNEDPAKAMNSIVIRTARLSDYEPHIEELRRRVTEFKRGQEAGEGTMTSTSAAGNGAHPGAGLVTLFERLAALHAAGSLSDEEFERAKRKLLG